MILRPTSSTVLLLLLTFYTSPTFYYTTNAEETNEHHEDEHFEETEETSSSSSNEHLTSSLLTTPLSNLQKIPMIGLGLGNVASKDIKKILHSAYNDREYIDIDDGALDIDDDFDDDDNEEEPFDDDYDFQKNNNNNNNNNNNVPSAHKKQQHHHDKEQHDHDKEPHDDDLPHDDDDDDDLDSHHDTPPPPPKESYKLIDTAHASHNERIIASSLHHHTHGRDVHVVTKVWYTHLGYARTKLSVEESLEALGYHVKLHVLIHWPRCNDDIEWMNCDEEERALPDYVKKAGPAPGLDPAGAFLDSWRALEELYVHHREIVSIGVSNFRVDDWRSLLKSCNIVPHVYQGSAWEYFEEPEVIGILEENNVLFQAYNVMHLIGTKIDGEKVPNASKALREMAVKYDVRHFSTLVLAWFLQKRVAVVVRSAKKEHFKERNGPDVVGKVPIFEENDLNDIGNLLHHVMRDIDIELDETGSVVVTVINKWDEDLKLYWVNEQNGELTEVRDLDPLSEIDITSFPGHRFIVKTEDDDEVRHDFVVTASHGGRDFFHLNDEL